MKWGPQGKTAKGQENLVEYWKFYILIGMEVTQLYRFVRSHQLIILINAYISLYINCTSISWF